MKKLVPLSTRIFLRKIYNTVWSARHYDSWPFGMWWSLWNRRYQTEGMEFNLPFEMMPFGFRSRFLFDTYEIGERTLCKKYLEKSDLLLELGGCIGIVSCVCNRIISNSSHHVVVEANPNLIPWVQKNRQRNSCSFAVESGMLSRSSNGDFRIEKFIVSGSANTSTGKAVKVPVLTIEQITKRHGFVPSALIMDIEGGEIDFLIENDQWIADNPQVQKLIVEVHPFIVGEEAISDFRERLRLLRFQLVEVAGTVEYWNRE